MRNLKIFVISTFIVFSGCFSAFAQIPSNSTVAGLDAENERYRIGFQDVLEVQVFRHPELTQRVLVSPRGTISLFRLDQPVIAVCRTENELAADIVKAYKEKYLRDPQVTVYVAEQKSQSIGVMGAVEKAGNFFVSRRVHLLEMLAMAGGPKEEAGTRLIVARTGSSSSCRENGRENENDTIAILGFKLRDVQEGKQTLWMKPGDVVSVLPADIVYVYGNVNKQGAYKVQDAITLTQAIVTAEGFRRAAKKDKVRILRQREGVAEREELVFDFNLINAGKIKDPTLQPNDIVAVSEDTSKAILAGIGDMIKGAVPAAAYRF